MLRTIRAVTHRAASDPNMTTHFTRQAAISPAVTKVQKPNDDLFSIKAAISKPTKVRNITVPMVNAKAERPKDGNSCSGLASGGPTARAPHEGQPRQRSTETSEPQEGQIIKIT